MPAMTPRAILSLFIEARPPESFVRMPDRGFYSFPDSYKPEHAARTHVRNENFNPDFSIRLKHSHDILVVEIKGEEDRYRIEARRVQVRKTPLPGIERGIGGDGRAVAVLLRLPSPEDFTNFFAQIRTRAFADWRSSLMQELVRPARRSSRDRVHN